jgi:hypothetical protein
MDAQTPLIVFVMIGAAVLFAGVLCIMFFGAVLRGGNSPRRRRRRRRSHSRSHGSDLDDPFLPPDFHQPEMPESSGVAMPDHHHHGGPRGGDVGATIPSAPVSDPGGSISPGGGESNAGNP